MVTENIESLSQRAQEAVKQRDWEKARELYQQAVGLQPTSADIHHGLATVCFQLRDFPSAARHFKEVTRLDPLRASSFVNLGAVYNILGHHDEAITALRRSIQLDPRRGEAYYNLGLVYRRKGQPELAIQAYREALRINPNLVEAHHNLANLHLEKEQYQQAIAHYKSALELRPGWENAERGLADAEAALAAGSQLPEPVSPAPRLRPAAEPAPAPAKRNLDRNVDPNEHGHLLTTLHKATIESENYGRHFQRVVESQIEPAIKELSSCLLYPNSSVSELDDCVQRFEKALQSMRSAQRNLQTSIERIRNLGDRLFES
jgi:tetratricopeptide (TPR) repeat protein